LAGNIEPLGRKSDPVALVAIICGVAPVPLLLFGLVPFVGCLATPVALLSVPAAIAFGIAGIIRARSEPEPNYVPPVTGLVLGVTWLLLSVAGALFLFRGVGKSFAEQLLRD
jgi:hypothetical protein